MNFFLRSLVALLMAVILPGIARAAGDAARGQSLAQVWCANCHLVEGGGAVAKDVAPPLAEIARRGRPDQIDARTFLTAPHPPMPNFDLARPQIDDIVAYLKSLAAR